MSEVISTSQFCKRPRDIVEKARNGERFTVLHRGRPVFDIVPTGCLRVESTPLESDSLYQASSVGESGSGSAAAAHDEVLYR